MVFENMICAQEGLEWGRFDGSAMTNFLVYTVHLIQSGRLNVEYQGTQGMQPDWKKEKTHRKEISKKAYIDNIRVGRKEIGVNTRNLVDSAQGRDCWKTVINAALKPLYLYLGTIGYYILSYIYLYNFNGSSCNRFYCNSLHATYYAIKNT